MEELSDQELYFTGPMVLSKKTGEEQVATISKVTKKTEDSPFEVLACLNVDWF